MTTVGHSLTGLSLAALTVPARLRPRHTVLLCTSFAIVANIPDLPLPGWGHDAYRISHSFFVTAALALAMAIALGLSARANQAMCGLGWALALAWLSHMLLDATYSHGNGLAVFWPVSEAHLALPIPIFDTMNMPPLSEHNYEVLQTELLVFGSAFLACILIRLDWRSRSWRW